MDIAGTRYFNILILRGFGLIYGILIYIQSDLREQIDTTNQNKYKD